MATRQALRIEGESAAEIPQMRQASFSWRPIEWRECSPRSELQSSRKREKDKSREGEKCETSSSESFSNSFTYLSPSGTINKIYTNKMRNLK